MVIDVHCHVGFSARPVATTIPRFSFEAFGSRGSPGYDSYLSPRMLDRLAWRFVKRWLHVDARRTAGERLDARIDAANARHWSAARSVDRLVLLAFDEYHDDEGCSVGMSLRRSGQGSDLYVSNSLVRSMCEADPNRLLFGASIHPYRSQDGRDACSLLEEVVEAGAVLIKWLPIHQNIRADDPRTVAFLRRAAALDVPLLVHYGGEMSLSCQHREFAGPGPLLRVLRRLRTEGAMPKVIVAHAATPTFAWQSAGGYRELEAALLGEFADAPLYADIAALTSLGRTSWLTRLARRPELHRKLIWGSDWPVPVLLKPLWRTLDRQTRAAIAAEASWIEQSLRVCRAVGFSECVFTQAADVLRLR